MSEDNQPISTPGDAKRAAAGFLPAAAVSGASAAAVKEALEPSVAESVEHVAETTATEKAAASTWSMLRRHSWPTLKYLTETEVHTYAFSVAANAVLSFFPAIVLFLTLCKRVFHSPAMYNVVKRLLYSYLPSNQDFIVKNVTIVADSHTVQVFSIIMLFISCTGVFLPLEVALNRVWGFEKNRNYLMNQIVSLALALGCGMLAILSVAATAGVLAPSTALQNWLAAHVGTGVLYTILDRFNLTVGYVAMKVFAIAASVGVFFLIYWLLPNGKVAAKAVLPAAVITGALFEISKYLYVLALPFLDFHDVYGPFSVSVTLIFWAFITGMLLLGGAYLSAAEHAEA